MWLHELCQSIASRHAREAPITDEPPTLSRRLMLARTDTLEREVAGEFGTEELAPLLAELAACKAALH